MPQVLMQLPDVSEELNGTMLIKEWSDLRNNLIRIGYDVIVLPKSLGASINFSELGMTFEDQAFVSVFSDSNASLAREVWMSDWFRDHQYKIHKHYSAFRSAADTILDSNVAWFGFGKNSSFEYKQWLDRVFDKSSFTVKPLQMHNEHLVVQPPISYLNQCFCPLTNGGLMWYPEAFGQHTQMTIRSWFKDRIEVTSSDMLAMACTAVVKGQSIIIPNVSTHLKRLLAEFGFYVIEQDMTAMVDKGLGCKSLIINVNE